MIHNLKIFLASLSVLQITDLSAHIYSNSLQRTQRMRLSAFETCADTRVQQHLQQKYIMRILVLTNRSLANRAMVRDVHMWCWWRELKFLCYSQWVYLIMAMTVFFLQIENIFGKKNIQWRLFQHPIYQSTTRRFLFHQTFQTSSILTLCMHVRTQLCTQWTWCSKNLVSTPNLSIYHKISVSPNLWDWFINARTHPDVCSMEVMFILPWSKESICARIQQMFKYLNMSLMHKYSACTLG